MLETAASFLGPIWDDAHKWAAIDPDPATRRELLSCLNSTDPEDWEKVRTSFAAPLVFGTAGLRGELGFGPGRFNVCLTARLAHALAKWLQFKHLTGPVVIGFDGRHKSKESALAAAGQLTAAGVKVFIQPSPRPTPALAFAARRLSASAALMITASHNPATDNGVKVYGPDARQIIPPTDKELAEILASTTDLLPHDETCIVLDDSIFESYIQSCVALASSDPDVRPRLRIAHTAMHGVALSALGPVFTAAGFRFDTVLSQANPDPDFPTTSFPNPEEAGAMDLVLALATEKRADLVLANDPDADRLAAAVRRMDGSYQVLSGDELGAVFVWALLRQKRLRGTVANTIVSSELIKKICDDHNLSYVSTLTGFKWLSHVEGLGFACEESIGYCLDPDNVRDKDGISAAVFLADLLAGGLDPLGVLEELDGRYGAHVQENFSLRISPESTHKMIDALLANKLLPTLQGISRTSTEDLSKSPVSPTTGLRLRFDTDASTIRLLLRPSGTEPKTKLYLEVVHASRTTAKILAAACRAELEQALT